MLIKIIVNTFKKTLVLLLTVFILFSIAIALFTISHTAYDNIEKSYEVYKNESNLEDFQFPIIPNLINFYDEEWFEKFEQDFDVTLEKKVTANIEVDSKIFGINPYNVNEKYNTIYLFEGDLPNNKNEILLSPEFLTRNNLKIGDILTYNNVDYKISGTAYFPEYIFPINVYTNDFAVGNDNFIPVYMNNESYNDLEKDVEIVHYSGKFNNDVQNKNEIYKEMMNYDHFNVPYLNSLGIPQVDENGQFITYEVSKILFILPVEFNPGISTIENEIKSEKQMFNILSNIVIIITIAVTIVLFNNIFESQKKEMGILKAEGISTNKLSFSFSLGLLSVLLTSAIFGFILGYFGRTLIYELLTGLFSLPITETVKYIYIRVFFQIIVISFFVATIVFILSIYRNLKIPTLSLIKNSSKNSEPRFKMNFLTKKLSFTNKYKLNIAIRNIPTSILLIFGILISSFLLLMGATINASVNNVFDSAYGDIFKYDYIATYPKGIIDSDFDENSIIEESNVELINYYDKSKGKKIELNSFFDDEMGASIRLFAYNTRDNKNIKLVSEETGRINSNIYKDGVTISSKISSRYGVDIGDEVTIINPYNRNIYSTFTVNDIVTDDTTSSIYFDIAYYQEYFDLEDDYANGEVGLGDRRSEIMKYNSQATYTETSDSYANAEAITTIITSFISFIMTIAVIISFITLVIIVQIVIKKNKKTISIMKVLGYTNKEINTMTTSIYKYIIFISFFSAIPLFKFIIQGIVNMALKEADFVVKVKIPFSAQILAFIIIMIIYYLSMYIAKRNIKKITLAESLKVEE